MIILWFYFTVWLFTWYSSKLMTNTNELNQYFHVPQMIFLFAVYLMPYFINYDWHYLIEIECLALTYPFCFNSGLNLYRRLPISHLGKYDFLTFTETIICLIAGIIGIVILIASA